MLTRLASEMVAEHAELHQAAGITWAPYNALRILRDVGDGALSCGEFGERVITRDSEVTRLLDRGRARPHPTHTCTTYPRRTAL